MLWLGWIDVGIRWSRGTSKGLDEALTLIREQASLSPHERGFISASAGRNMRLELSGHECTVRVSSPAQLSVTTAPAWVGVSPASDALAAGAPDAPLPMLRIDVINAKGAPMSGVLLVAEGLFDWEELERGLRLPMESSLSRPGCLPVLASDRRPTPVLSASSDFRSPSNWRVFRCDNPNCRARGQEVLVQSVEHDALLKAGHCVAYPCPSCIGPWPGRWALSYVRVPTPQDATRGLPSVLYPMRPTRRRRLPSAGPMQLVERSDTGLDLAQWMLPPVPVKVNRFLRSRRMGDLIHAMREDPVRTGSLLCGILTNENLRSLVHGARMLPPAKRGGGIPTALAHGLFPRRAGIYKLPHAQTQLTHHQYIALDPEKFFRKMVYYGVIRCKGSFLDVGSGIGEKAFLAHALGRFSRCDGIEYDERTLAVAQFLLRQISTADPYPIHFQQADALTFDRYGDYEVIYMFRPMHDVAFMSRLFRHIAQQMQVGAKVYDVFRDDCALRKVGHNRFVTTRLDPRSGNGVWDVPISLEDFLKAAELVEA